MTAPGTCPLCTAPIVRSEHKPKAREPYVPRMM